MAGLGRWRNYLGFSAGRIPVNKIRLGVRSGVRS